MTGREALDRPIRAIMGPGYVGMGLFLAAVTAGVAFGEPSVLLAGLPPFAFAVTAIAYAQFFGLRCPACRANLSSVTFQRVTLGRRGPAIDRRFRFCPYCGIDLDEPLPGEETSSAGPPNPPLQRAGSPDKLNP